MHTNPPESISLNKYSNWKRFSPTGWILILMCLVAFVACKPKTPLERAALELKNKGFLSEKFYIEVQPWSHDTMLFKQYLLEGCYQTYLDKYGINLYGDFVSAINFSFPEISEEQLKLNTINRINELNAAGIFTKKEYDHLIATANERLMHPDMVWEVLLRYYHLSLRNSPDKLMQLSSELHKLNLLDDTKLVKVNQQIAAEQITNAFELIASLENVLQLNTENLKTRNCLKAILKL